MILFHLYTFLHFYSNVRTYTSPSYYLGKVVVLRKLLIISKNILKKKFSKNQTIFVERFLTGTSPFLRGGEVVIESIALYKVHTNNRITSLYTASSFLCV